MTLHNPFTPFLTAQGWVVLDGGLATELENRGANINDALWSARLLLDAPEMIRQLHYDYFAAGADVAISASYQASFPGFARRGLDQNEAIRLMRLSVELAQSARDDFWADAANRAGRLRPLVAASIGCYGAFLADGSEYRGDYGLSKEELIDWHRPRLAALVANGPDLLACETIPCQLEAEALVALLAEFPETSAWISFSCQDESRVCHGENFADCVALAAASPQVVAVGVNCTPPRFVESLLAGARRVTDKPLLCYPNSGEAWDASARCWETGSGVTDFGPPALLWRDAGAQLLGGCCRTGPDDIHRIRDALRSPVPSPQSPVPNPQFSPPVCLAAVSGVQWNNRFHPTPRENPMHDKLNELKTRLAEVDDLSSAAALLAWDQQTHMPPGGAEARGRQMATLQRLAHEKFTDEKIGYLLEELRQVGADWAYDSDEAALLRVTQRQYTEATQIPADFVAEIVSHGSAAFNAWTTARPANDFAAVRPLLEKTLDLSLRYASYFPGHAEPIDTFIDRSDYGMTAVTVGALFDQLREALVPLVQAIGAQPLADDAVLRRGYPEAAQIAFGEEVVRQLGYDFSRGRQDKTFHPFATKFSINDVRITTRLDENFLTEGLSGSIHEAGHAMYEQGVAQALEATPLASGTSAGVHESQSRLWENLVGRSRHFWVYFFPALQAAFPAQLSDVSLDTFYRAINRVEPSLIRVEADEVTYNLHVMLRFDLERALLNGKLAVADLPAVWNGRMESDLGLTPPDDRDGVLQDVHWFDGLIGGGFQGYTLGNVMSAQFFAAAQAAHPEIPDQIRAGSFDTLRRWLTENIYRHGAKFTASELVERATGGPLSIEPYMAYLRCKYGELYGL